MEQTDVRQKLLITAGKIFASKGFADAKIRHICAQAEVNVAAVNYYFGDKENLYFEAVSYARQSRANENPLPDLAADPETRLKQFVQTLVNRTAGIDEPPWEVQLIIRELLFPTEACRRLIEEYFRPFFNQLLSIIQELSPQKNDGPMPEATAYRLGYSIVGQVMYLRFTSKNEIDVFARKDGRRTLSKRADRRSHISLFTCGPEVRRLLEPSRVSRGDVVADFH